MKVPFGGGAAPFDRQGRAFELLRRAREGDNAARDRLIHEFTPFVIRAAARLCGRYLRLGEDDEVSIGLVAFNEAIDRYDFGKGVPFLTFSETVIRRRLIDYYRKERQGRREIPMAAFEDDEAPEAVDHILARQAVEEEVVRGEAAEIREEVLRFKEVLAEYGISFADLVTVSPRHGDARLRAMQVARVVASTPAYRDYLREKKQLPLKVLEDEVQVSRKTLERQRKYIIAVALVLMSDFSRLSEYIRLS